MAISKVTLNGTVLMDVTQDTVVAATLLNNETAHKADGTQITGTYVAPTCILQAKSVTPTETAQTVTPDNGYDGLSQVSVGAISTTYVGSGIARKASADMTVSGKTVTAPAGYYASAGTKSVADGSATTPATTITANPSISVDASGLITATTSATKSVTPTVSAGYVSSGTAGTITVSGSNTSQLTVQAAATITPTESAQTAVAAGKYTTGAVTVAAISSTYVGSGIVRRNSSDVVFNGGTVSVASGYYPNLTTKDAPSGLVKVAQNSSTVWINNPTIDVYNFENEEDPDDPDATINSGIIYISVGKSQSYTPYVQEGYVSAASSGTLRVSGSLNYPLPTITAQTIDLTSTIQTIVPKGKFTIGAISVNASGMVPDDGDLLTYGFSPNNPSNLVGTGVAGAMVI